MAPSKLPALAALLTPAELVQAVAFPSILRLMYGGGLIEALRAAWLDAPDVAARRAICEDLQRQAWIDVPYIPLGAQYQPIAYSKTLSTPRIGFMQFYDVKRG